MTKTMLQLDEGNTSEYEEIQIKVTFCSESFMEYCSPMGLCVDLLENLHQDCHCFLLVHTIMLC